MATTQLDWAPLPMRPFVETVIAVTQADSRVVGLIAGGSAAAGAMDEFSDLDFVVVSRDEHQAEMLRDAAVFAARLGPLLSSFTAEHVREPRLLICLYGPPVLHVDLKYVADKDLDGRIEDGIIVWQRDRALDAAFARTRAVWPSVSPQWVEDRFWTWIYIGAAKVGRGEYLACIEELAFLRRTVFGPLIAQSRGYRTNGVRRIEQIAPDLVPALEATFGDYAAAGCIRALRVAADLYQSLRGDFPQIVRRTGAETASLEYIEEIEAQLARVGIVERSNL